MLSIFLLNTIEHIYTLNITFVLKKNDIVGGGNVRPEKFQFLEKWQNRNFGYKIVISVKNLEFIL